MRRKTNKTIALTLYDNVRDKLVADILDFYKKEYGYPYIATIKKALIYYYEHEKEKEVR